MYHIIYNFIILMLMFRIFCFRTFSFLFVANVPNVVNFGGAVVVACPSFSISRDISCAPDFVKFAVHLLRARLCECCGAFELKLKA